MMEAVSAMRKVERQESQNTGQDLQYRMLGEERQLTLSRESFDLHERTFFISNPEALWHFSNSGITFFVLL